MKLFVLLALALPSFALATEPTFHTVKRDGTTLENVIVDSNGQLYELDSTVELKGPATAEQALAVFNAELQKALAETHREEENYRIRTEKKKEPTPKENRPVFGPILEADPVNPIDQRLGVGTHGGFNNRHLRDEQAVTLTLQYGDRLHARVSQYNRTPGWSVVAICGRIHKYESPQNPMNRSLEYCMGGVGFYVPLKAR